MLRLLVLGGGRTRRTQRSPSACRAPGARELTRHLTRSEHDLFFFEQRSEHDLDPVQGYRIGLDCVWAHVARRTRRTALLGRVPAVRGKTNNACAGAVGAARPTATGMCARGSGGGGAGTAPASRWPVASFPAPHGAILPSLFARQEASSSTRRRA